MLLTMSKTEAAGAVCSSTCWGWEGRWIGVLLQREWCSEVESLGRRQITHRVQDPELMASGLIQQECAQPWGIHMGGGIFSAHVPGLSHNLSTDHTMNDPRGGKRRSPVSYVSIIRKIKDGSLLPPKNWQPSRSGQAGRCKRRPQATGSRSY